MQLLNVMFYVQEMELAILSVFLLIAVLILLFDRHRSTEQIKKYEEQIKKDNELLREYKEQIMKLESEVRFYYPYYEKHISTIKKITSDASRVLTEEERKSRIQRVRDAEVL
jgi:septal ring factor EnvC (AmiA/AmiB activator)